MATIFDRLKIAYVDLAKYGNLARHEKVVALLCARMSGIAYLKSSQPGFGPRDNITSADLVQHFARTPATEGGEPEGMLGDAAIAFTASVPGGSAVGFEMGDTLIVAFRGTQQAADWGINLFANGHTLAINVHRARFSLARGSVTDAQAGVLHLGFYSVARSLANAIDGEIDKFDTRRRARKQGADTRALRIIFCGHSLGGALAVIAASGLPGISFLRSVDCVYTFGMPKLASAEASPWLPASHFRYELKGDPVPGLPPSQFGLRHDKPAIHLDPKGHKRSLGAKIALAWTKAWGRDAAAAAYALLADEHRIDLYIETIDAMP